MLGERHFATRERLAGLAEEVRALAEKSGTAQDLFDESLSDFLTPFRFLICGAVNAGKSTFLNALFGVNHCPVSHLPETKNVTRYSYREKRAKTLTQHSVEYHLPDARLKNYHLIDTPGSETFSFEQRKVFLDFVAEADLVFFLFPIANPWSADTWDCLSRVPEELQPKVVLVLQQVDQKEAKDVQVVIEHMHRLSQQKIGRKPRVFPVSAQLAAESKKGGEVVLKTWKASGFPELESFVDDQINYHTARRRQLREVCGLLHNDLQVVEGQIEDLTHRLATEKAYLEQLENDLDALRAQQMKLVDDDFSELGERYEAAWQFARRELHRKLSLGRGLLSLFQEERVPQEVDRILTEATHEEVKRWAEEEGKRLTRVCREHWKKVAPLIEDRLEMRAPDFEKDAGSLTEARGRFIDALRRKSRHAISDLKLRSLLDAQLELRRSGFRRYMGVILGAITAMGVSGGFQQYGLVWFFLAVAVLFGLGAVAFNIRSRSEVCRIFSDCVSDCRKPFTKDMNGCYRDAIRAFFGEYSKLLNLVRRHIAENQAALEPQSQEWNDLFLELKGIEQSL